MTNKEKIKIEACTKLLKQDGINSKNKVSKILNKLLEDHEKKWGKLK